jgi:hypothetical protein
MFLGGIGGLAFAGIQRTEADAEEAETKWPLHRHKIP